MTITIPDDFADPNPPPPRPTADFVLSTADLVLALRDRADKLVVDALDLAAEPDDLELAEALADACLDHANRIAAHAVRSLVDQCAEDGEAITNVPGATRWEAAGSGFVLVSEPDRKHCGHVDIAGGEGWRAHDASGTTLGYRTTRRAAQRLVEDAVGGHRPPARNDARTGSGGWNIAVTQDKAGADVVIDLAGCVQTSYTVEADQRTIILRADAARALGRSIARVIDPPEDD